MWGRLKRDQRLIELRDQYLAQAATVAETLAREKGMRQWISAKVARLDLAKYGRVSTTDILDHETRANVSDDDLRAVPIGNLSF